MRIRPMMLAQTRLLVPNTFPIKREAASSAASVVIPETNTVKSRYRFMQLQAVGSRDFIAPREHYVDAVLEAPGISRVILQGAQQGRALGVLLQQHVAVRKTCPSRPGLQTGGLAAFLQRGQRLEAREEV